MKTLVVLAAALALTSAASAEGNLGLINLGDLANQGPMPIQGPTFTFEIQNAGTPEERAVCVVHGNPNALPSTIPAPGATALAAAAGLLALRRRRR